MYYSASLSFFTIFSLLPIIALMIVTVSTVPFFDNYISLFTMYLLDILNPTHSKAITTNIELFLSNSNQLGNLGIIYLLIVFTLFFNNYEDIVNKIFNVQKRPIHKMVFLYLAFLFIVPILFVIFIFTTSFIQENILLDILTFIFLWILFIMIFQLSVNTSLSFKASVFGSALTLLSLSITKKLFIYYIIYNTTYATIYGSLSILLFFFLWIYISWTIYLYGIKITALLNKTFGIINND